jgi:hypothetical protein
MLTWDSSEQYKKYYLISIARHCRFWRLSVNTGLRVTTSTLLRVRSLEPGLYRACWKGEIWCATSGRKYQETVSGSTTRTQRQRCVCVGSSYSTWPYTWAPMTVVRNHLLCNHSSRASVLTGPACRSDRIQHVKLKTKIGGLYTVGLSRDLDRVSHLS